MTQDSANSGAPVRRKTVLIVAMLVMVIVSLAALWRLTPLSEFADPDRLADAVSDLVKSPWAPLTVMALYLVANATLFPTLVLNMTMILALGAGWGFAYALYGSMVAALAGYLLGRLFGRKPLERLSIRRLEQTINMLKRSGLVGLAVLRLIPFAPYPVVNVVLGAAGIGWITYTLGTFIGLLPSLIAMTAVGHQIRQLIQHPDPTQIALLVVVTVVCIGGLWGVQSLARRKFRTTG
ncbi:VTT domain-containing protein [uncultured Abyssibacter sp.]|uniref:TVP38/TMEM64 family protein n=1 Tax=uncultured Abyssibacter sp. TaxID=2320202 RepID=UPI0032B2DE49